YPVVDPRNCLVGVITRRELIELARQPENEGQPLVDVINKTPIVAFPDEPLRVAADRMAETDRTQLPVVERKNPRILVGMIGLSSLLTARRQALAAERYRERVLRFPSFRRDKQPVQQIETNADGEA